MSVKSIIFKQIFHHFKQMFHHFKQIFHHFMIDFHLNSVRMLTSYRGDCGEPRVLGSNWIVVRFEYSKTDGFILKMMILY